MRGHLVQDLKNIIYYKDSKYKRKIRIDCFGNFLYHPNEYLLGFTLKTTQWIDEQYEKLISYHGGMGICSHAHPPIFVMSYSPLDSMFFSASAVLLSDLDLYGTKDDIFVIDNVLRKTE